ncbi:FAD-dependent oxidoreductase [Bacillus sp. 31A1R]|uniref:FAD-dependent oxidoreductase n=1 Tax=Robertmurraya mangrovi TaxID=3098077 RepID=A0ABU5J3F3_9BACI|nr:FAD-dependent oxidoreductase [Bacillus sp. 31A1R]MDZ5473939.1 FAD-dependent oxidoreductase [Bacillus sp. 31A1R]
MRNALDVLIIGAGLSGLYSAFILSQQGITNFKIIEAQDRIGGRVHTLKLTDQLFVDLGGQWISSKQKRISSLVKAFQFETIQSTDHSTYDLLGRRKTSYVKIPPIPFGGLYELWKTRNTFNKLLKEIPSVPPFQSETLTKLDQFSMEQWLSEHIKNKGVTSFYKMMALEGSCMELEQLSMLDALWCIKTTGSIKSMMSAEEKWLKKGTQVIVEELARPCLDKIVIGSPVKKIIYNEDMAIVETSKDTFQAKKVILTVPIHLINKISFSPPLPKEKYRLISSLPSSHVIKTIIMYNQPFWKKDSFRGTYLSDNKWLQLIVDTSQHHLQYGVLTCFTTGPNAIELRTFSMEQRKSTILHYLESLLGLGARNPIEYIEKDWDKEEWTQGGYGTHFPPEILSNYGGALFTPIGPLHWAGTETSTEWRLYMEGALQSGERAALEILDEFQEK